MEKIKKRVASPNMLLFFLVVKVVTYYGLIDVNILFQPLLIGTVGVFWILFTHLSESKCKKKEHIYILLYGFFSIIMFADTMYYNYYNQTVSIQQIYQASNVAKVPSSFLATLIPASFFIVWDIPISIHYFRKRSKSFENGTKKRRTKRQYRAVEFFCVVVIVLFAVNPFGVNFAIKVNTVGFYTHHIKDIIDVAYNAVHDDFWKKEDVIEAVEEATEATPAATDVSDKIKSLEGIAKGKNVIVIQLEAFQNFVIGAEYNGQELTPNLNKLIGDESIYFDNYYSVIGKGNTADAEFATLNSMYPVIDGESYRLYTDNTYNGLPWKLKEQGYETFAFHGNEAAFWNRQEAYPYQGIDHFYSIENMDDTDIVGLGISDSSMFRQMVDVLEKEEGNFFSFGISLSSHHPYELDEELQELTILAEDEKTKFANYLQAVHYTDKAVGELIENLKKAGLYEDTLIAFYGDHHGLNCTMDDNDIYVSNFIGKQYGYEEMMKVPCIIHIPGCETSETVSTLGCQVDFLPTMAYLMDFEMEQPYIMGQNLLTAEHGFVAFTAYLFDGSFGYDNMMFQISREGVFEGSTAWDRDTLETLDIEKYKEQYERAVELKEASKQVLEQDLIGDYVTHEEWSEGVSELVPEENEQTE